ncbi:IS66 family transposase [Mucilaginibacter paludis]|uniref:Transposase IS66 n=1 Tax=Mucilaginibacter paludis DSM 18603 TaxID=714943 RepID=H1YEC5_9SPHI|nr:IS66 family transposase [Mucilaginibacter paludis]EHQ26188.1 transposase IS66 [Mucilaginibacter paludis DSM 18603]
MSLNNNLSLRQQLKLSNRQLNDALEREQAKDIYVSFLEGQNTRLTDHNAFLQTTIRELNEQLAAKEQMVAEQTALANLLQQNCDALSSKLTIQDTILADFQQQIDTKDRLIAKQQKDLGKLDLVRHGQRLAKKDLYGRKSEKLHEPAELPDVFGDGITDEELAEAKEVFYKTGFAKIEKTPVPSLLEQNLPVTTKVIKLDIIPEGVRHIGTKTSRRLVYHKAWTEIQETIRYIYMREDKQNLRFENITEKLPARPMKCKADVSVSVQLAIDRWLYHSPVQRTQNKFAQAGVRVPYSTLLDWSNAVPGALSALHRLHLRDLVKSGILHCDETGLTVLDKSKKQGKRSHRGQILGLMNPLLNIVGFQYLKGRGLDDIAYVLRGFKGYLHTDGYTGYNKIGKRDGIQHGRCLAHTRRYYFNARDVDKRRSFYVLKNFINPLYAIERKCRSEGLDFDQITEMRQKYAVPILSAFRQWLTTERTKVKEHSPMAKAIEYTLRLWDGIMLYTTDGMLSIDNNCLERAIRPIALGKKSWMFAGSHESAPNAAVMYSFFGTCKLHGIDPEAWLADVLNRIAHTPKERLSDLLPQYWKLQRLAA